ncbi:S8 family serine peptidase [Streptomyces sp. NPDC058579]|uniref:S8 family peptidase n=1 Tax=Streptomyces sp. NPDC058579 TaxID=3346548 RepID=UPI003655E0DF
MPPLARVLRSRAIGLLGAMTAVVATWTVAAPTAQAEDMRGRQWYLDAMKADGLWKVATGKGITVAVLDSGVDSTVSELRGKVLPGHNFYDAGEGPGRIDNRDDDRHGTNMAIAIAGSGANGGVKGIAPDAKILPVRTGDFAFFGNGAILKGIRYAVDNGARVINISQGGPADEAEDRGWLAAVEYAQKKGALIFAGSGNEGLDLQVYPAAIPGVVAVGALDTKGKVAEFSNYGSHLGLAAPGVEMPGRCTNDKTKYCAFEGTSHATALASGTAALIWSAHPDWTANQVLRVMMETAGHVGEVPSKYIGYGSIRPAQVLLEGKGNPGDPDVNPLLAAQKQQQAASQSPAPQTSPSPGSTGASGTNGPTQEPKNPESAARPDEGGFPLWGIAVSAVAVVAVVIGAVVAAGRRNRRA